jgi:hypothetical protein
MVPATPRSKSAPASEPLPFANELGLNLRTRLTFSGINESRVKPPEIFYSILSTASSRLTLFHFREKQNAKKPMANGHKID